MPELTKEHFDQQLKNLVTKTDLEEAFEVAFDKQAILINNAFQGQKDHFDQQVNGVNGLDDKISGVKKELKRVEDSLKTDIQRIETKVDKALHTEYINLEVRVKRIEQKIGLKPA